MMLFHLISEAELPWRGTHLDFQSGPQALRTAARRAPQQCSAFPLSAPLGKGSSARVPNSEGSRSSPMELFSRLRLPVVVQIPRSLPFCQHSRLSFPAHSMPWLSIHACISFPRFLCSPCSARLTIRPREQFFKMFPEQSRWVFMVEKSLNPG